MAVIDRVEGTKETQAVSKIFMNSQPRPFLLRTYIGILLCASAGWAFGLAQNTTASELFRRMQTALGGADKLVAIRDFDQVSEEEMLDQTGATIRVQKHVRWIKPNRLRVDQLGPFDTYVLYFDGNSGWEILPNGTVTDLKDRSRPPCETPTVLRNAILLVCLFGQNQIEEQWRAVHDLRKFCA
jgi:hypothetical protein